jgi:hypothetical protein
MTVMRRVVLKFPWPRQPCTNIAEVVGKLFLIKRAGTSYALHRIQAGRVPAMLAGLLLACRCCWLSMDEVVAQ